MKTVLVYSGGLDSTVLLYDLIHTEERVLALTVDYGQRHRREVEHAKRICGRLNVHHRLADLRAIRHLLAGSSQTSASVDVPEGHYTEESMKATVVPNRNMIMLAVAAGWATAEGCDRVAFAAHSGDHAIYPDCREPFVAAMGLALEMAGWHKVDVHAPYLALTKEEIVGRGVALGVPFAETWSCYKGGTRHCGKCGTCVERREAFGLYGMSDPTIYQSV